MNATNSAPVLRLSRLPTTEPTIVRLVPDASLIEALRTDLGLVALRKVRLQGSLRPQDNLDWHLEAELGATVVQPCSVTLAPVTTRIDLPVVRRYLAEYAEPEDTETEMPEDDSIEPLPETIDLVAVLTEALALALPDFPRAEGVELAQRSFAGPGVAPLTDDDVKPFAGLADLKKQMDS